MARSAALDELNRRLDVRTRVRAGMLAETAVRSASVLFAGVRFRRTAAEL